MIQTEVSDDLGVFKLKNEGHSMQSCQDKKTWHFFPFLLLQWPSISISVWPLAKEKQMDFISRVYTFDLCRYKVDMTLSVQKSHTPHSSGLPDLEAKSLNDE